MMCRMYGTTGRTRTITRAKYNNEASGEKSSDVFLPFIKKFT